MPGNLGRLIPGNVGRFPVFGGVFPPPGRAGLLKPGRCGVFDLGFPPPGFRGGRMPGNVGFFPPGNVGGFTTGRFGWNLGREDGRFGVSFDVGLFG